MDELIVGSICIIFGVYAVVQNRTYTAGVAEYQERIFGIPKDKQNIAVGRYIVLAGGVLFTVVGVLLVLQVIHFGP